VNKNKTRTKGGEEGREKGKEGRREGGKKEETSQSSEKRYIP
jgi:hypothetical protein